MFYKGTEIKFIINLEAEGFSMDDDDFDIEVVSPKSRVKGCKRTPREDGPDVMIFKDADLVSSDSSSSGDPGGTWCAIAETKDLDIGELRVIATAYIPDANANDGIRVEVVPSPLGRLVNP